MRRTLARKASLHVGQTLVGRTGTPYHIQKILYERKHENPVKDADIRRLWLATYDPSELQVWSVSGLLLIEYSSNDDLYVVKPVTAFHYDHAFRFQKDLAFSTYIRLPVDSNDANRALIFRHYTDDFLRFMQSGPVSRSQVKQILLDILRGIADCHSKDWVHCGINALISPANALS